MKHLKKPLVLLLSAILLITACVPAAATGGEQVQTEATAPQTTEAEQATVPATAPEETGAETVATEAPEETGEVRPEAAAAGSRGVATDETFTITYDLNGGVSLVDEVDGGSETNGTMGQEILLPETPEKDERTFAGWRSAQSGEIYPAGSPYVITGDDTLTAQWNMLQVLTVAAEPEGDSSLARADRVVLPISEAEQENVEAAVDYALKSDTVAALDVLAADISFLGDSGQELEPEEGENVPVSLVVPQEKISEDAEYLVVYHMVEQEDGSYFAEPVQYLPRTEGDQEISFGAEGFSIYAVASVGKKDTDEGSVLIEGSGTSTPIYEIEEEKSQVFFFQDPNADTYKYHRYVWSLKDNDNTVRAYSTSIYFQDKSTVTDDGKKYQYPWISLDALRPGSVTLVVTYYCYNGNNWWKPTDGISGTVEVQLTVTPKENGLAIENHIPENGTLTPVWRGVKNETPVDHYVWTKEFFHSYNRGDGSPEGHKTKTPIDEDAILADGSINVAIDGGGIAQEKDSEGNDLLCIKFYTCTAYDKDGNELGSATHRVEYGEDVLNGSFEYPAIPSGTGYAFANGTRQLFWKSTAPGDGSTLGQDVELGNDSSGNPYLTSGGKANDGTQYAELNAEKAGSLYQDVLTAPGATLEWAFAHRSRKGTGVNVMYLVIAASKNAQSITNQTEINALVKNYAGDGVSVDYNGGVFTMWKFEGNESYWQEHKGTYTVPDNQYATRFFFVSATGTTLGNLLDGVHFNESQRYVVEYYLNGTLQSELTEIGNAEVDSVVVPENTDSPLLKNAILTASTINGANYGGVTLSIKARKNIDEVYEGCRNVLRLYYTTGTVSVRKIVEIEGWDDLSAEEKNMVGGPNGYTASFLLYDAADINRLNPLAEASVTIDLDEYAHKTAVAVFMDWAEPEKPFAPAQNHSYLVEEETKDTAGTPHVYDQTITYAPATTDGKLGLITTDAAGTGSCTVTNYYEIELTSLTIRKEGWEAIDENQTFVYRVQGMDGYTKGKVDLTVTVHGNGSVTILDLPTGTYQITEVASWSWRYTPVQNNISVLLNEPTTVTFQNVRVTESNGNYWRWLNGGSWEDNRWLDGKKLGPEGEEGGGQND